jgi:hypothetical protein
VRENSFKPFVTTNNVLILNEKNLILATDRGPLALQKLERKENKQDPFTITDPNKVNE